MKQKTRQPSVLGSALVTVVLLLALPAPIPSQTQRWFSGVWDSSNYNLIEKPRTVGLRIELVDRETGLPVKGARVLLKGFWLEEDVGPAAYVPGATTQEREFEMRAVSADDGVVVFALSWQKEYPWLFGRPAPQVDERGNVKYYDVHSSWRRAMDDIEKVRWIEIGHPGYIDPRIPLDFNHLTEFGQDKSSERQNPQLFREFEEAWHREMRKPRVRFCVLNIGHGFSDFGNKQSTRPEFFGRIKAKDFGTVYREPMNMMSPDENRPSVAGPYFVYQLRVELERRSGQMDINISPPREEREKEGSRDRGAGSRRVASEPQSGGVEERGRRTESHPPEAEERKPMTVPDAEVVRDSEREDNEQQYRAAAQQHPLGIAGKTLSLSQRRGMGLYAGVKGVLVNYVLPSSPAYRAGLRAGMVIETVYQRTVSSTSDLDQRLEGKSPGEQILIGVWKKKGSSWERDSFFVVLQ
jgi:hypothetical protein